MTFVLGVVLLVFALLIVKTIAHTEDDNPKKWIIPQGSAILTL